MPESTDLMVDSIPEPGIRFKLGECISSGVLATVYEATDSKMSNKKVAIKILKLTPENETGIQEEYRVLKDFSDHPNLPDFYGIFKTTNKDGGIEIWFAMEFCEGGSVMDIVRSFYNKNRRMAEVHIAFILKETTKALIHLHSNNIIHRYLSGDNILLTKEGEIKLVDFCLARSLPDAQSKRSTCIGAACWMAPEVVLAGNGGEGYGSRADVWALGITAIELGDGKPPLSGMHPTRVMFQTVRNPPPGLYRPGNWSEQYNDFVAECLEKNPEYRPFMEELIEHPFLTSIPENCHYLTQEFKKIMDDFSKEEKPKRQSEPVIKNNLLQTGQNSKPLRMFVEDLAAIENMNEDVFLSELKGRFSLGYYHSFVGDVLLILNPNENQNCYDNTHHVNYTLKSRSSNPPHIYAIADRAYQDALHQEVPQHIILSGESGSGKTTSLRHLVSHLSHLGDVISRGERGKHIQKALEVIHSFVNAGTDTNWDSTRCIMNVRVGYGPSGKVSTGRVDVWQLEKWRISSTDILQSNFHILYYFYDAMELTGQLNIYLLNSDRNYRYLRIPSEEDTFNPEEIRNNPQTNIEKFQTISEHFKYFDLTPEEIKLINRTLAAVLNLGEIRFNENDDTTAEIENPEACSKVAELLNINEKKFIWSLTNYCLVDQGTAIRRKNNCDQARDARDMLANCLYSRLVDWIVNYLNNTMALNRALLGEKYFVNILDYFGFECFKRNDLEQLLVNTFNEQMQYLYIQRVFAWETLELLEEEITPPSLNYYNNKRGVDQLLGKPGGILGLIDEASKTGHNYQHVLDSIERSNNSYIDVKNEKEFFFSHYTGKINYDIREMTVKNRDFLPPEMIETLRLSSDVILREFFVNKLSKTGNLMCNELKEESKWSSALISERDNKTKKLSSEMQYSQTKHMRTAITTFRSVSLEILRELSVGAGSGGTHFIRCIRTNLISRPKSFHRELIKQQLRALSVLDTARARQLGFPHRITFSEFLRRYKFLAFDFDENVDVTKDNCRLLLVRLKMEGWVIGKSKVFLKYYNEEYLSRLYETQVKKIIKIQSMMRAFLARRNVASKIKNLQQKAESKIRRQSVDVSAETAAALLIQKAYRGYNVRKNYGPLINKESGQLDKETANFLKPFVQKWKKKSMFQVLLQYRSAKFQDLNYLSQQVHIFNQNIMHELQKCNEVIDLEKIDSSANADAWLGAKKPSVWKLPFDFKEIPYFDTEHMCGAGAGPDEDQEKWDSPLEWRRLIINEMKVKDYNKESIKAPNANVQPHPNEENLINTPYVRDPNIPIVELPNLETSQPNIKIETELSKQRVALISPKKIPSPLHASDKNFEGANQDFEFIRSPSKPVNKIKRRHGNPIAELESMGRKNPERSNDDDPPFNFQGMLRKTNFKRDSMKKIPENVEEPYSKVLKNKVNKQIVSTELAPGVILEGIEIDL